MTLYLEGCNKTKKKSFKSLILFNFMANNLDPVTNVVFSGPGVENAAVSVFPPPFCFLLAARCWRIWHLWKLQDRPSMRGIVQHIVHLLFTALPVVEEEFFACRGSVRRTSTNRLPTDRTDILSRWRDESHEKNSKFTKHFLLCAVRFDGINKQ